MSTQRAIVSVLDSPELPGVPVIVILYRGNAPRRHYHCSGRKLLPAVAGSLGGSSMSSSPVSMPSENQDVKKVESLEAITNSAAMFIRIRPIDFEMGVAKFPQICNYLLINRR